MFKLRTALLYVLIAVNCCISADGIPYQSQDLGVHPGGSCISAMRPVMDYVVANQIRWNTCEDIIANHTRAEPNQIRAQLAALQEAVSHESRLESNPKALKIPQDFEQFGTRYFYIEHSIHISWTDAEMACRRKFGRLATIQNEEELTAISAKLKKDTLYWLGINDLAKKGDFVSLSSGNRAFFLKWRSGEPNYGNEGVHCVAIINGEMSVEDCNMASFRRFICQADDKI
ncbi:hypothetical protein KR084_012768 [Drosophila pseudotakahashii]|nr:hypothetical protein KR084_012768 [Drosophila pseudotakahashii]